MTVLVYEASLLRGSCGFESHPLYDNFIYLEFMKIQIDNSTILDIVEDYLIIKNNKLYNNNTKQYEGVEGDRVTFIVTKPSGTKCQTSGIVDGYTCGRRVKIRGVEQPYDADENCEKVIETLSRITDTDCDSTKEKKEDWDAVLNA